MSHTAIKKPIVEALSTHEQGKSLPLTSPYYKKPSVFRATTDLHQATSLRPIVTEYDPKKNAARTELVLTKYKCEKNGVPITAVAGSTTPLVEKPPLDEEAGGYNPFEHRKLSHPTSDMDTLIHLLKGSLGSGILAMPMAFKNAGLAFGVVATFTIGFICTYCVHILVKCSHIICRRTQVPSLGFAELAEAAFLAGPRAVHKFSGLARAMINIFLVVDLLGCCCVYIVFVATNIKQVVDHYTGSELDLRLYMVMLVVPLILLNLIRNLKWLAPFSMVANLLMAAGVGITFYYVFTDVPSVDTRPHFASFHQLPLFFGTAIFALEGIGVVMPLENNMKTPGHFIGCPGVLNIGMGVVVTLYTAVGFFGFLKYGDMTEGSITLNLPVSEVTICIPVESLNSWIFLNADIMPDIEGKRLLENQANAWISTECITREAEKKAIHKEYCILPRENLEETNEDPSEIMAQSVKVMIAVAIFLTYGLQFYVPMEIIWKGIGHRFGSKKDIAEYAMRIFLVIATVVIAVAIPQLGPFISLVGAVCLSTLGLMFPAIIELVTYWDTPGLGTGYWLLWKNILIIMFGILGFVTGTLVSIEEIIETFGKP